MTDLRLLRVLPGAAAEDHPAQPSVPEALTAALAGGRPIAPLPVDELERRQVLDMLTPDHPVIEDDAAVVVATSGSTGHPKGVVLSRSAITASAHATHQRLGGPGDWVLALPQHYVAGLMIIARTVLAGTHLASVPSSLTGLAEARASLGERAYVSVVPTQLIRALRDRDLIAALARFDAVLLGGAAAAPELLRQAADHGIRIITTYGMSETCGGCVYDGVPLDGVGITCDLSGRVTISGTVIFSGYRLRPDLTSEALLDGRLLTRDRGRLIDGRLQILGRIDDVVISGGLNVDLAAVEALGRSWPRLAGRDIAIIGVPDTEWGTRVVAVIEGGQDTLAELHDHLSGRLPRHALPRELIRLTALPRTSSGKIDRQRLVELSVSALSEQTRIEHPERTMVEHDG